MAINEPSIPLDELSEEEPERNPYLVYWDQILPESWFRDSQEKAGQ